jgi:hypothetical protein
MDQRSGLTRPHANDESDTAGADAYLPVQAFLGLYLVLIAFFIMLTAMSTFQPARTADALASLKSVFPSALSFGVPEEHQTSLFVEARRSYADRVGRLLAASLPEALVDRPGRGDQIEARVALASLFKASSADPVAAADKALAGLALVLAQPGEAGVFSVECLLPAPGARGSEAERLALARASSLARRLIQLGAPPASVAVGLDAKPGEQVRLLFYVRPADAPRLDFKSLS